jgi:hypothetical protein
MALARRRRTATELRIRNPDHGRVRFDSLLTAMSSL